MAEFWMMEHGLLSPEKARKACEKKQRRQKELRTCTPIKSSKPSSKPESSHKQQLASKNGDVKAKKRINNDFDDNNDDFILSPKRRKGQQRIAIVFQQKKKLRQTTTAALWSLRKEAPSFLVPHWQGRCM